MFHLCEIGSSEISISNHLARCRQLVLPSTDGKTNGLVILFKAQKWTKQQCPLFFFVITTLENVKVIATTQQFLRLTFLELLFRPFLFCECEFYKVFILLVYGRLCLFLLLQYGFFLAPYRNLLSLSLLILSNWDNFSLKSIIGTSKKLVYPRFKCIFLNEKSFLKFSF